MLNELRKRVNIPRATDSERKQFWDTAPDILKKIRNDEYEDEYERKKV